VVQGSEQRGNLTSLMRANRMRTATDDRGQGYTPDVNRFNDGREEKSSVPLFLIRDV
jgi:hypothetical protein